MNHKLRVLVRVDVDPGHVTLEITGCVTQSDSQPCCTSCAAPAASKPGADVVIDLHGASHLDPEVLLDLRRLADAGHLPLPTPGAPQRPGRSASPSTSRRCCQSASCTSAPTPKSSPDSTPSSARPRRRRRAETASCRTARRRPARRLRAGGGQQPAGRGNRRRQRPWHHRRAGAFGVLRGNAGSCGHGPGTVRHGAVPARRRPLPPPRHQQPVLRGAHLVRACRRRASEPPPARDGDPAGGRTGAGHGPGLSRGRD